ncbi:PREDICTED: galactosylceramide sulfotransferase-like [Priapulus caudatus]|uniref:Galactosylceramide sulfotransferase-like n=1 Tax=Priapulus caudatus TaxID=37621 RepID=A0ABM1ENA2_PRICU|nr:PREDICTED: galactosylceramide sulfotransferase-like [Priapulus caudatus]
MHMNAFSSAKETPTLRHICERAFSRRGDLKTHMRTAHAGENRTTRTAATHGGGDATVHVDACRNAFSCLGTEDGTSTTASAERRTTTASASGGERCTSASCVSGRFAKACDLRRAHCARTGEKRVRWTRAIASYSKRADLTVHVRTTHGARKPYKCHLWRAGVRERGPADSKVHLTDAAPGREPRSKCHLCELAFSSPGGLQRQRAQPTVSKNRTSGYVCKRAFCTPGRVQRHIRTHAVERPYKCDLCDRPTTAAPPRAQPKSPAPPVPPPRCSGPVKDVYFMKTHKCASSSLQNIFLRYGHSRNLTFVLPVVGFHMGYPQRFSPSLMIPHASNDYNIFCHHARWDELHVRALMPRAAFVSVVRRPAALLESIYSFMRFEPRYGVNVSVFLQDPAKYARGDRSSALRPRNTMLYDFGMDFEDSENEDLVDAKIARIFDRFDLIMIVERFDESLVLLRDLLCWSWDDVIVVAHNERIGGASKLSAADARRAEAWSWADGKLYDVAVATFDERVRRYGAARMRRDVARLRRYSTRMYARCVERRVTTAAEDVLPWSNSVVRFVPRSNASACVDLLLPELVLSTDVKLSQLCGVRDSSWREVCRSIEKNFMRTLCSVYPLFRLPSCDLSRAALDLSNRTDLLASYSL